MLGYGSGLGSPFDPYPDPILSLIYEQAQDELAKVHKCSSDPDRPFTVPCWLQLCDSTGAYICIYIRLAIMLVTVIAIILITIISNTTTIVALTNIQHCLH